MNRNRLVLTVYSRTVKAANDDGLSNAVRSSRRVSNDTETRTSGGWDPFEVWRSRIRPTLKLDPQKR